jgi:hypothetical protein
VSRHRLPTGVPCGVCLARITGWREVAEQLRALPCQHRDAEIRAVADGMLRIRFGQYAEASR